MRETMNHYAEKDYALHAYVILPDHLHILMVPFETLEKAVQLIKGGFSFRAKRAFDWKFEIWQQGFTDHRIRDEEDWEKHIEYIRSNPVKTRLAARSEGNPYLAVPNPDSPQGLKPRAF
jgi:putative transposase